MSIPYILHPVTKTLERKFILIDGIFFLELKETKTRCVRVLFIWADLKNFMEFTSKIDFHSLKLFNFIYTGMYVLIQHFPNHNFKF